MTTRAIRGAAIFFLALWIGACTSVGHIQREDPVRTMTFDSAEQTVQDCAAQTKAAS